MTPDVDDLAVLVAANEFELVSPSNGEVIGRLSEPVAGTASLDLLYDPTGANSGALQWQTNGTPRVALYGPPGAGNPASISLDANSLDLFSGGGLGFPAAGVELLYTSGLGTSSAQLKATDGAGTPQAYVTCFNNGIVQIAPAPVASLYLGGRVAYMEVYNAEAVATGGIASPVPAAATAIAGAALTVAHNAGDVVYITAQLDHACTAVGAGVLVLELFVNGGAYPKQGLFNCAIVARNTETVVWRSDVGATGNYTWQLYCRQAGAGSHVVSAGPHTSLMVRSVALR